jgi:hypothetical protein
MSEDVLDDEIYGFVTYRAPAWAFEDFRSGSRHDNAVVHWPGRLMVAGLVQAGEDVLDGISTYEPRDTFCDLTVAPDVAWAIEVSTFGTLVERLVSEGERVTPGTPLFVLDARPPTTGEWLKQRDEARRQSREAGELRRLLRGEWPAIVTWRRRERRQQ